jgi:hypothetical protein
MELPITIHPLASRNGRQLWISQVVHREPLTGLFVIRSTYEEQSYGGFDFVSKNSPN